MNDGSQRIWSYQVHDGRVFCPRADADIDAATCATCRDRDAASSTERCVLCLPPNGEHLGDMIEAIARA